VTQGGVQRLALLQWQLEVLKPLAALGPEQVRAGWLALQPPLQRGMDLVLAARPRVDELLATREPAA